MVVQSQDKSIEKSSGIEDYCAVLDNEGMYSIFSYGNYVIRFQTSDALERYTKILEWNHGYLVVMAKYKNHPEEEEYIDLVPILENLYIDIDQFLTPIQKVRIQND